MNAMQRFRDFRNQKIPLVLSTCYDFYTAQVLDESNLDAILVGDSLAMVSHGFDSTLHATPAMMNLHISSVRRGAPHKFIIGDMPFLSTRAGIDEATKIAGDFLRSGSNAVKIEGLDGHEDLIPHLIGSGIPVMGHLGLQPQSVQVYGGYQVQGLNDKEFQKLQKDALALEKLGCFSLVLECVPAKLATEIQEKLGIPVIGIGAGAKIAGQILVLQDLWGFGSGKKPKFVRKFGRAREDLKETIDAYINSVHIRDFPLAHEMYYPESQKEPIRIIHDPKEWQNFTTRLKKQGSIGFVPTMGSLHEGHGSLVERAKIECDFALVSIFVNPTQFNDSKDLDAYPRVLDKDLEFLDKYEVLAVFAPQPQAIYPDNYAYKMTENDLSTQLEGEFRPGHFDGMLSVVMKLLNLTQADKAFFGEKDFQQLKLVEGMVKTYFIPTVIVPCKTMREESGLAMSSRNERLSSEARKKAAYIYQIISAGNNLQDTEKKLTDHGFEVEYLRDHVFGTSKKRLVAIKFEGVRLIDNIEIGGLS